MRKIAVFTFIIIFIIITFSYGSKDEKWYQLKEGGIVLLCHDRDVKTARKYIKVVLRQSDYISKNTGCTMPDEIRVVITESEAEFNRFTGGSIPDWGIGAAIPANKLIILKSPSFSNGGQSLEKVITHELSHIMISHITNHKIIERWFDEGLAQYQSGEGRVGGIVKIARAVLTDNLIPLDKIDYVLAFRREKASLAYAESRAALDFIAQEYGTGAINAILLQLSSGNTLNNALISALHKNQIEFQYQFFKVLKKKYRWAILLDSRLIISMVFVLLFIFAYVNVLRKKREYRDDYEIEESDENTPPY
ncbi:hypothetical protein J7K93_12120 [bacterium]|nr:hypothetical protein [bacterium]